MNYINAHATSTLVGDVAEVKAIKNVFSDVGHIKINGTKSLIGHCLGAAGGMEAIATIEAIRTGYVHPTLNQARPTCGQATMLHAWIMDSANYWDPFRLCKLLACELFIRIGHAHPTLNRACPVRGLAACCIHVLWVVPSTGSSPGWAGCL